MIHHPGVHEVDKNPYAVAEQRRTNEHHPGTWIAAKREHITAGITAKSPPNDNTGADQ